MEVKHNSYKNKSELEFEKEVIQYLTTIGDTKQWEYKADIKTTEQLWDNFKRILERNNYARIGGELSNTEFIQVKKIINNLKTPYEAGQFLYGVNGVSEVEVNLDDGRHVYLTVFDQAQVGGGNTVYQIVNQIQRKHIIDGKQDRRFDITMLINGLPIIQIELKRALHNIDESLNQMKQYISERQYGDIYSTLQILIAMTPYDVKYMANSTLEKFNLAFAFNWQTDTLEMDKKNKTNRTDTAMPVRRWKEFSDMVLSIPMAHDMSTRYMILDGTKNNESIKVMRPYQVFATKRALDKIRSYDFKHDDGKLGYVWHTTGSGKTITSFKTAWLASRLPNIDKVVFLVDRIALTNQTVDAYRAYDPVASFEGKTGVVMDTANVSELHRKLSSKSDKNIIVTSIQKMARYIKKEYTKPTGKRILFIVDEAHRSTGDGKDTQGMLNSIKGEFKNAAWLGYTGTPKFPETRMIFGNLIHSYTIKDAIADRNVLGFNVEFKETIEAPANPTEEDIDDNIKASVYDTSEKHVELVVKDIFDNWRSRSKNRKYNALLTVHVGGNKASTPRAMEYFDKFVDENSKRPPEEKLKVAISYSLDTSNKENQLSANNNLHRAIEHYKTLFGTVYDMSDVKGYTDDVMRRLNKTSDDGLYLDLVIVVDQLLTGFDAPELNTLYIDRTLKGANLVQAYSRTNRIHNSLDKPFGNIINYRWPVQNEIEMNSALAIYSNRVSADEQIPLDELIRINSETGVISKPYIEVKEELKTVISELSKMTNEFVKIPSSEIKQDEMFELLQNYSRLLSQIKQYTMDEDKNPVNIYEDPESFYNSIGITEDQEITLTTVLAGDLKEKRATRDDIDISNVNLCMVQVREVRINYDYLTDLIAKMADQVHRNDMVEATKTKEDIHLEIAKSNNDYEKQRIQRFVFKIFDKEFEFDSYPVSRDADKMRDSMDKMQRDESLKTMTSFIRKWGLDNSVKPNELESLIMKHKFGQEDLDKQGELNKIINDAKDSYSSIADADIAKYKWIMYRVELREAFYKMADTIKDGM